MKVIGLDGKQYPWTVKGYMVDKNDIRPRSSYHLRCRAILNNLFATSPICEEVSLPGSAGLTLDFYLPRINLAIEVQGEQHYKMVSKFHSNRQAFINGQRRDSKKREWCRINNITLIELHYKDTDEEWTRQIINS